MKVQDTDPETADTDRSDLDREDPSEATGTDFDDEGVLERFSRDSRKIAEHMIQEDPESEFGLMMFDALKGEPGKDAPVTRNRRAKAYELRAKRVKRLAQIMIDLTPFQERFVHHYVQKNWDSLSDLAIMAGSNAKKEVSLRNIAATLLRNPKVIEAIGLLSYSKLEAEGVDRHEVIAMFRDNHAVAIAEGNHKEANVAAEKLGTIVGLFGKPSGPSRAIEREMTKVEAAQYRELQAIAPKERGGDSTAKDGFVLKEDLLDQLRVASKAN